MYSVVVKIDGIENRRRSAGLLHIVIGFFLLLKAADYYRLTTYKNIIPVIPILLVASFSLFYGLFRSKLDRSHQYNYWLRLIQVISFSFLGILLIGVGRSIDYIGVFMFVLLSIILLFSERKIFQETALYFEPSGIRVPGYYRDHLVEWPDLTEVVVREDFITLFHKKQKYLQFQVRQDLSTLEVAKLNAFCREQLEPFGSDGQNNEQQPAPREEKHQEQK